MCRCLFFVCGRYYIVIYIYTYGVYVRPRADEGERKKKIIFKRMRHDKRCSLIHMYIRKYVCGVCVCVQYTYMYKLCACSIYIYILLYMLYIIMCIRSIIILYANYGRPPPPYNNNNKNNNTPCLANRSPRRPLFAVPRTRVDDVFRIPTATAATAGLFFSLLYIYLLFHSSNIYIVLYKRPYIYIFMCEIPFAPCTKRTRVIIAHVYYIII